MRVIGITGKARSGKDSIGAWFRDYRSAYVTSFAWPIKAAIEHAFSLPHSVWDGPEKELTLEGIGKSPRFLAQTLGTEWGRELLGPDIWVQALERRLRDTRVWYAGDLVVVTDCRFENEAAWVRQHGQLVHVRRPGADGNVGVQGHASEAGILPAAGDVHISNSGSLLDLYDTLVELFPAGRRA